MRFEEFEHRAHEIFDSIPPDFKEGVDGLQVERNASPHPSLPDIYTLGECRTEHYPSDFGGPGEVRSFVVLFYGSFLRLSRRSEAWDWEEELWETITHEIKHHLESLALEDALEVEDYVNDQNFARREGESFDPFFFRDGRPAGERSFEVDGDLFIETEIGSEEIAAGRVVVEIEGRSLHVPLPDPLGDVHFVSLAGLSDSAAETVVVLIRRRSFLGSLRNALAGGSAEVLQSVHDVDGGVGEG